MDGVCRDGFPYGETLYEHMYPKPLEIICYHCQQAIKKLLKGVLISKGVTIKKTHDLGLLAEMLQEYTEVDEKYLEMCDDLTPYRVKIRYPQEFISHIFLVPFKVPKGIFKWHFEFLKLCLIGH